MARVADIAFVLLLSLIQCLGKQTEVVQTTVGPVKGVVKKTVWHNIPYNAFLGIPFAQPPLGKLRFKPPVPIKPWSAVFNADKEGASCPQLDIFSGEYIGAEDCLFINVMSRKLGHSAKKPVMVWIYGGAFFAGNSNTSLYGPDFFLEEDVVFVSFNYRLGAAGFLALGHPEAVGNAGMKDQVLALRWVQDNIAAFGGDPDQVTIFGESAGAVSVGLHTLSDQSKGLFKQVIMESGTPLCQWGFHSPNKANQNGRDLAWELGYTGDSDDNLVKFLQDAPIKEMVTTTGRVEFGVLPFRPTIENPDIVNDDSSFLTECPIDIYKSGNMKKAPTLMGFNKNEAVFFINFFVGKDGHQSQILSNILNNTMGISGIVDKALEAIETVTFDLTPEAITESSLNILNDIFMKAPIDLVQKYIAQNNGDEPLFYYMLSYQSKWNVHEMVGSSLNGTGHMDDIGYLFNVQALQAPTDPKHFFNVFRKKMVSMWTNFAKYGHPTPSNVPFNGPSFHVNWLDSKETGAQLEINEKAVMRNRMINLIAESYQAGLNIKLPIETGCNTLTPLLPPLIQPAKPADLPYLFG